MARTITSTLCSLAAVALILLACSGCEDHFQHGKLLFDNSSAEEMYDLQARIELCRSKREKMYQLANPELFNALVFGELVKFESQRGKFTSIY